ncbi:cytosine permease [Agrilactobacillus yilanensis]|uniref:Cytosine permease n=1 Tax=Agrilactobacillus yilanensis TaxID=2485997 RepID=A0ABW4J583_9LACO|nr:cytosine permease [Agrilactobacillus yilanensis]
MDVVTHDWSKKNYLKLWMNVSMCVPTFLVVETLAGYKWNLATILVVVLLGSAIMGLLCGVMGVLGRRSQKNFVTLISDVFGHKYSKFFYFLRGLDCAGWYGINIAAATQLIINLIAIITGTKIGNVPYVFIFILLLVANAFIAQSSSKLQKLLTITLVVMAVGILMILINTGSQMVTKANFIANSPMLQTRDIIGSICVVAAYWNGFALNMFDFGRNAKTDKDAFWGNFVGIIIGMAAMAIIAAIFSIQAFITTGAYNWNLSHSLLYLSTSVPVHIFVVAIFLMFMISTNSVANYYPAIQCIKAIRNKSQVLINALIFLIVSSAITPFFLSSSTSEIAYYWINLCGTVLAPLLAVLICYVILQKQKIVKTSHYRWTYVGWTALYMGAEVITRSILSYLWLVSIIGIFLTIAIIYHNGKRQLDPLTPSED